MQLRLLPMSAERAQHVSAFLGAVATKLKYPPIIMNKSCARCDGSGIPKGKVWFAHFVFFLWCPFSCCCVVLYIVFHLRAAALVYPHSHMDAPTQHTRTYRVLPLYSSTWPKSRRPLPVPSQLICLHALQPLRPI